MAARPRGCWSEAAHRGHHLGGAAGGDHRADAGGRPAAPRDGAGAHLPARHRGRRAACRWSCLPWSSTPSGRCSTAWRASACPAARTSTRRATRRGLTHASGPTEPELDRFELAAARAADERGPAGARDLPGAPGAQRGARRHAPPASRGPPPGRRRAKTWCTTVGVADGTRAAELLGSRHVRVNSFHHQGVDRLGRGPAGRGLGARRRGRGDRGHRAPLPRRACSGTPSAWSNRQEQAALFAGFVAAAQRVASPRTQDDGGMSQPGLGASGTRARPTRSGVEEEVMLLNPHDWSLAQQIDRVIPVLPAEFARHVTTETHKSALELSTCVHQGVGRRRRGAAGAANEPRPRSSARSGCGRPAPAPTPSPCGTRPSCPAGRATSWSTARCGSWPGASPPSACTCTWGCPTPRTPSISTTGCGRTCRCCSRCRSTRPSGRAGTPAWPPRARRSSRRSRGWASRARSRATPSGSRPWTCWCAARPSRSRRFLWWDVRLQPRFGTVELRIFDAQTTVPETAALAALVQSIARLEIEEGYVPRELIDTPEVLEREPLHRRPRRHGRPPDRPVLRAAGARPPAGRASCSRPAGRTPEHLGCEHELEGIARLTERTGRRAPARVRPRRGAAARTGLRAQQRLLQGLAGRAGKRRNRR